MPDQAAIRILIADDDERTRRLLRYMLEQHSDVEVVGEAANGEETLALTDQCHPSVLLLDVRMPPPSGLEVARRILARDDPPHIVFVTGYERHAVDAFDLQASDYLVKPFSRERLGRALDRIRHLIERRQMVQERERLRKQLEQLTVQSVTDPLTGAYNRRYLDERLREELKRARRHRQQLACLMIDVDHFKPINDAYGHGLGDLVLRQVAEHLQKGMRETDILARYGGEEFTLVLPETEREGARTAAEKLRTRVEQAVFGDDETQLRVTVSIGAGIGRDDDTAEALLDRADVALYRAKRKGRNRVECAED